MNSIRLARTGISLSLLYSLGLLLFLAFPDPYTPLSVKILPLLFIFALMSFPAFCFYLVHLCWPSATPSRRRVVLSTSCLFFLTWLILSPLVVAAARSDALGALSLVWGPLIQFSLWIVCGIALLFVKKQPA